MKGVVRDWIKKIGFDIVRLNSGFDVDLYRAHYSLDSVENRRFYNIGAGAFFHPCWTNIDNRSDWYDHMYGVDLKGIEYDLFSHKELPIEGNSAELIYLSHILEHIDNDSAQYILNESYRTLKPGGTIRIVAPDIDREFKAWKENDRGFFFWINDPSNNENLDLKMLKSPMKDASTTQVFIEEFATHASELVQDAASHVISDEEFLKLVNEKPYEEVLDYCISFCPVELQKKYPFRHMNWFNENKLTMMLNKAGFNNVYSSRYRQSAVEVLRNHRYFDTTLPMLSLYIEGVK